MAKIFLDVFNLSITASWLIAVVMLVRLVIRHRAPKWVTCLLWAMVGIRLILPFSLESAVSLVPSRETIIPESVYGETVVQQPNITPPEQENPDVGVDTPNDGIDNPNEGVDIPDEYVPPVIENIPEEYIHSGIGAIDDRVNPIIQSTVTTENGKSKNILQTVTFAASCVWVFGMVSLVIYAVINYLLLKKRIATSIPEGKNIRKSEAVGSPFILGVFRPRIYMPFGLSKATEEHVLAHERAHLKRGDHLIKPIGYAILTVHWFNPLVWLGYILLCRDIEYACDEKVVKNMSAEARKAYAEALLECGVSKSRISACPVAFGETGVKKRVKNTLNYKKPLFWVMIAAIIICAAVAVLFLTSPAANDKETSDTSDVVDVSEVSDVIDESDVSLPPEESKTEESKPEESKPEESKPEEDETSKEPEKPMISEDFPETPDVITVPKGYEEIISFINNGEYRKAFDLLQEKENDIYAIQLLENFEEFYIKQNFDYNDKVRNDDGFAYVQYSLDKNGFPISMYRSSYSGGGYSESVISHSFNKNGLLTDVTRSYYDYHYDTNGTLIKITTEREKYSDTTVFTWYDNGLLASKETTIHSSDDKIQGTRYAYDSNGRMIHKEAYSSDQGVYRIEKWKHDSEGRIIEETVNSTVTTYTYGENRKLIKAETRFYDGTVAVETLTYDENGNLLVDEKKKGETQIFRYVYEYDENGYRTSFDYKSIEHLENDYCRYEYTYDENGRVIKMTEKGYNDHSGKVDGVFEYTYDENGDLIKKTHYCNVSGSNSVRDYEGYTVWYHKYLKYYNDLNLYIQ